VLSNCKRSLLAFKEENRIPSNDAAESDELKEKAPLLVGDETGKEMPYTQEATIRTHFKRLNKFVRLVDYLIVDSKIAMINQSTSAIGERKKRNINYSFFNDFKKNDLENKNNS